MAPNNREIKITLTENFGLDLSGLPESEKERFRQIGLTDVISDVSLVVDEESYAKGFARGIDGESYELGRDLSYLNGYLKGRFGDETIYLETEEIIKLFTTGEFPERYKEAK